MSKSKGALRRKRQRRRFHARTANIGRAFVEAIGGPGAVVVKPRPMLLYTENPARVIRDLLVNAGLPVSGGPPPVDVNEEFNRHLQECDEPFRETGSPALREAFKGLAPDGAVVGDEPTDVEIIRPGSRPKHKPG